MTAVSVLGAAYFPLLLIYRNCAFRFQAAEFASIAELITLSVVTPTTNVTIIEPTTLTNYWPVHLAALLREGKKNGDESSGEIVTLLSFVAAPVRFGPSKQLLPI